MKFLNHFLTFFFLLLTQVPSTEISNMLKLLPSSAEPMEQDDTDLNLQSKTSMMQNTGNSQVTSINGEFQSNMIELTTLNKNTLMEETIQKERSYTKAAASLSKENDIYINDKFITEGNQEIPTENRNQVTNKLDPIQPSTTKPIESKLL